MFEFIAGLLTIVLLSFFISICAGAGARIGWDVAAPKIATGVTGAPVALSPSLPASK